MLHNIIDRRKRPYRWREIDVIAEATWHDNAIPGSDYAERNDSEPSLATQKSISLADAVIWASRFPVPMTLYIYDAGSSVVSDDDPWRYDPIPN
jgi:hypothetical protein